MGIILNISRYQKWKNDEIFIFFLIFFKICI
jgi:hypothetical protein